MDKTLCRLCHVETDVEIVESASRGKVPACAICKACKCDECVARAHTEKLARTSQ